MSTKAGQLQLPLDHHAGQGAGDAVNDLDGETANAQLVQTGRLNPGDEVVGAGEILGQLHTIQVAERLATWAALQTSVSMSTYALSIAQASSPFNHATL